MSYLNSNARTVSPTKNEQLGTMGRFPTLTGVFVGFVKRADDVQRNGRLQVWIPELGSAPEEEQGWITVNYCSPFAGATNIDSNNKTDFQTFEGTQTSYGMWMIPPDINNQVLVMFVAGDPARGIWIGSLYNQFMNTMIPGMAASANNWQHPGKIIPVAEYNKWNESITNPDRAVRPYEKTKFKGVGNQGLINDQGRGVTSSSARREAPSQVFGIITPGPPVNPDVAADKIRRKGGSSFIMDDGTGSEYVELATKSGAKIRLDETNGFVYIINRDGTAWMQMDQQGHIDVFSQFDISIRAQRDINMRADRDINLEAGQNFYISAAKDTITNSSLDITYDINNVPKKFDVPYYSQCARGLGYGGNIVFTAEWDIHTTTVQHNYYNTTLAVCKGTSGNKPNACGSAPPDGTQHYWSKNNIILDTYKNFHFWAHCVLPEPKTCYRGNSPAGNYYLKSESIFNLTVKATPCGPGELKILTDGTYSIKAPLILEDAPVQIMNTLDVGETITVGENVSVVLDVTCSTLNALVSNAFHTGCAEGNGAGPPTGPGVLNPPRPAPTPELPVAAIQAEQKALTSAGNILPPIKEPFFTRGMQSWPTIVTRWPTYEPCPLHEQFKFSSTTGYSPAMTEGDKTYVGSSSGPSTVSPKPNTDTGANNTTLPPAEPGIVSKDFNNKAFQCQLKQHEGERNKTYLDSKGLPTGGIGHLMRPEDLAKYPLGSEIPQSQIDSWFAQDSATAIKDAQNFVGTETWEKLDDNRKRAVADMAYNMGSAKLGQFKTFKKEMQAGNYDQAAKQVENTPYYQQVGRRGPAIASQIRNGTDLYNCGAKNPTVAPAG